MRAGGTRGTTQRKKEWSDVKKLRRTLHRASSLFACLLAIRWGIWLLGQIPPVLALWQAFLNSALGRVAAYQFTAGALSAVPWEACINILLGKPGTAAYLALCALDWLKDRFPAHLLRNGVNGVRSLLSRPAGMRVIHRQYLRTFSGSGGHELFFDLTKEKNAEIPGTALSVVLEADGAALCRDGSFLRLLPERQVVALDGVELEYIPFTRKTVLLTK